jgi:hypothetical protein
MWVCDAMIKEQSFNMNPHSVVIVDIIWMGGKLIGASELHQKRVIITEFSKFFENDLVPHFVVGQ